MGFILSHQDYLLYIYPQTKAMSIGHDLYISEILEAAEKGVEEGLNNKAQFWFDYHSLIN